MKKSILPVLLVLYCISAGLGLFLGPSPSNLFMTLWLTGFVLLALAFAYREFISHERFNFLPFLVLGIIELNFIGQVLGGAHYALWPAYFLVAALVAVFSPLRHTYVITGLVLAIEGSNLFLSGQWDAGKWPVYTGYAVSLCGVSLAIAHIVQRARRDAARVKDAHERLLAHADAVNPLADSAGIEALTEERRLASNVNAARQREDAFAGLIDMIYEFVPAHTYALFLKESRDGRDVYTLRAKRSVADERSLAQIGAVLDIENDHGIVSECARMGEPRSLSNEHYTRGILPYYSRPAVVKSVLAVPILRENEIMGVLACDSLEAGAFSLDIQDMLGRFAPFFIQIIEKIRMSHELDGRMRTFAGLHTLSSVLSSSLDLGDILDRLVAELKVLVPHDFCLFVRCEEQNSQVVIAHQSGTETLDHQGPSLLDKIKTSLHIAADEQAADGGEQRIPIAEGTLLHQMLRRWQAGDISAYHFGNLGERGEEIRIFDTAWKLPGQLRSLSCWPLVAGEKFIGAFFLGSEHPDAFSEYHRRFLDTVMNQTAVVMDNAILHQQVRSMAHTDGLTGLLNHRTFMDRLDGEFQRLDRAEERHFSLLLLDIDFFKKVNDEYGHPVGDVALKTVAGIIRRTARSIDFVARYGGEEFAVGMVGAEKEGAGKMAERIRRSVEQTSISAGNVVLKKTVSIGVASYSPGCSKKEMLIDYADQALYQAKHSGRNRVCLYAGSVNVEPAGAQPLPHER